MQCIILELGNQVTGSRRTEGVVVVDFKQESFYYRKETFHLRIVHLKKEIGRNTVCDPLAKREKRLLHKSPFISLKKNPL